MVTIEDLGSILAAVRLDLKAGISRGDLAQALNRIAIDLILGARSSAVSTAGETAAFLADSDRNQTAVLEPIQRDPHPTYATNRFGHLMRGDRAEGFDDVLPDAVPRFAEWVRESFFWQNRTRQLRAHYESKKGASRKAPAAEVTFFHGLADIFEVNFGRKMSPSMGGTAGQGGPGIRFVMALVKLISDRLPLADVDVDDPVPAILNRLSTPTVVAARIRRATGKQPQKR